MCGCCPVDMFLDFLQYLNKWIKLDKFLLLFFSPIYPHKGLPSHSVTNIVRISSWLYIWFLIEKHHLQSHCLCRNIKSKRRSYTYRRIHQNLILNWKLPLSHIWAVTSGWTSRHITPDGETQRYSEWEIVLCKKSQPRPRPRPGLRARARPIWTWVGGIFQGENAHHSWLVLLVEVVWWEIQSYSNDCDDGGGELGLIL